MVYVGFSKGLVKQVVGFLSLGLGFIASLHLGHSVLAYTHRTYEFDTAYLPILVYLTVFLAVYVVFRLVGLAMDRLLGQTPLSLINRLCGALFGLLSATFILGGVVWLLNKSHLVPPSLLQESLLYPVIRVAFNETIAHFGELIPWLKELMANIEAYFDTIAKRIDTAS
jgi:uncharacterized membrane protein required for colicin V production